MFCTKCGTENLDNAVFCKECGNQMIKDDFYGNGSFNGNNSFNEAPATVNSKLTDIFASGNFLALAIFSTISLVLTYSSSFLNSFISMSEGISAISSFTGSASVSIFTLIITVCLWIIYSSAKSGKGANLSCLKAVAILEKIRFIISIILSSLLAISAITLSLLMAFAGGAFKNFSLDEMLSEMPEEVLEKLPEIKFFFSQHSSEEIFMYGTIALIVILIIGVFATVLASIFNKIKCTQINALIDGVKENHLERELSTALKVFLIIFTVFSFLGLSLGNVCSGIYNILLIIIINKINTELKPFIG